MEPVTAEDITWTNLPEPLDLTLLLDAERYGEALAWELEATRALLYESLDAIARLLGHRHALRDQLARCQDQYRQLRAQVLSRP